jgi:hypothetical protein
MHGVAASLRAESIAPVDVVVIGELDESRVLRPRGVILRVLVFAIEYLDL